jgi:hypothetical protein
LIKRISGFACEGGWPIIILAGWLSIKNGTRRKIEKKIEQKGKRDRKNNKTGLGNI